MVDVYMDSAMLIVSKTYDFRLINVKFSSNKNDKLFPQYM